MISRDSSCEGKRKHETFRAAEMERRKDKSLTIYKCPFCQYYHVGHKMAENRTRKPKKNHKWSWRDEVENFYGV